MRFTLSWLKDFLQGPITLAEVVETCNRIGHEVESIEDYAELANFRVAEVKELMPHPNADRLRVCTVFDGTKHYSVVCGAPNVRAGMKTVFAPIGTVIPEGKITLKRSRIRDVESDGMLCSMAELALSSEQEGIIELPDNSQVGESILPALGLDDPIIELSITPNRGDCLHVYGLARDLAAAGLGTHHRPSYYAPISSAPALALPIVIQSPEHCHRFVASSLSQIRNGESPDWMQRRLRAAGQQPINLIVDVTNYVALTFGHPMHAYDYSAIEGGMTVHMATPGETITLLDGTECALERRIQVVADHSGPLCLAGVMGGARAGVSEATSHVMLEAAHFSQASVVETGRHFAIHSAARYRFERHVPAESLPEAMAACLYFITKYGGGTLTGYADHYPTPYIPRRLSMPRAMLAHTVGYDMDDQRVSGFLTGLGYNVTRVTQETIEADAPHWRADITDPKHMIEDCMRMQGCEAIPSTPLPPAPRYNPQAFPPRYKRAFLARQMLAYRGYHEVVGFSMIPAEEARLFGADTPLTLANPISQELAALRPSTLPVLLRMMQRNRDHGIAHMALCEMGPVFHSLDPLEGATVSMTGIRMGRMGDRNWHHHDYMADVYDSKADLVALLRMMGYDPMALQWDTETPSYFHPRRSARLRLGKQVVAYLGECHPTILAQYDCAVPVSAFELYLSRLPERAPTRHVPGSKEPSRYPSVQRDFAFILDRTHTADAITRAIRALDKALIQEMTIFDIYRGPSIEPHQQSLAFTVILQAPDRTLKEDEITAICDKVVDSMSTLFNASLRAMPAS